MVPRSLSSVTVPPARVMRIQFFVLVLCALSSLSALAFNSSLQPQEVEEAYSLGKTSNHEDLADFLNQYGHDFKYPADNSISYVSSVEFQTPYEQIVLRTLRTINYDKFQAEEDYQANPGLVIVRVLVSLKTGYTGPAPPADSFKVSVSQARPVEPRKVTSAVVCDPFSPVENSTFANCITYTREILLQFDVGQFAPGRATVRVMLPAGQPVETKYNLDKLK
ncbi:MAG TPA: hypothetical protein VK770_01215 [Candidatus Acidoferrum sp.]|jgi:hypothetical protein|nr:hypothetical protein [Candidatus Acidoferrum sp.]